VFSGWPSRKTTPRIEKGQSGRMKAKKEFISFSRWTSGDICSGASLSVIGFSSMP